MELLILYGPSDDYTMYKIKWNIFRLATNDNGKFGQLQNDRQRNVIDQNVKKIVFELLWLFEKSYLKKYHFAILSVYHSFRTKHHLSNITFFIVVRKNRSRSILRNKSCIKIESEFSIKKLFFQFKVICLNLLNITILTPWFELMIWDLYWSRQHMPLNNEKENVLLYYFNIV